MSAARPRCVGLTLKLCLLKTNKTQTAGRRLRVRRCCPALFLTLREENLLSVPSQLPPSGTGPGSGRASGSCSASTARAEGRVQGSRKQTAVTGMVWYPQNGGVFQSVQPYTLCPAIDSVMDSGKGRWARNLRFRGCSALKGSGFSTGMDFVSRRVVCVWLISA